MPGFSDIPREPERTLVHNEPEGRAYCVNCGWHGVPNREGGERVPYDPPRRHMRGWGPVERVIDSTLIHECPTRCLARRSTAPEARTAVKVSRNAPCPCGSGRKAKKCCHR